MRINVSDFCLISFVVFFFVFFFQAEDGIRDDLVTGVQTCALPISEILMKLFTLLCFFQISVPLAVPKPCPHSVENSEFGASCAPNLLAHHRFYYTRIGRPEVDKDIGGCKYSLDVPNPTLGKAFKAQMYC